MNYGTIKAMRRPTFPAEVKLADARKLRLINTPVVRDHAQPYEALDNMHVIVSLDTTDEYGELLHVSISYPNKDPKWQDIRMVKDAFFGPNKAAMMVLPEEKFYVNLHTHAFHLWEMPIKWEIM